MDLTACTRKTRSENENARVIAGLVSAISISWAWRCQMDRDGRNKSGHDGRLGMWSREKVISWRQTTHAVAWLPNQFVIKRKRSVVAPENSIKSPLRRQLVTWESAAKRFASLVCRSGSHCAACKSPGTMVIELSPTVACAGALAHHRSIEAAPFSSISRIGMRLEPRIGAWSSISSLPNGNCSLAMAGSSALPRTSTASQQRQRRRGLTLFVAKFLSESGRIKMRGRAVARGDLGARRRSASSIFPVARTRGAAFENSGALPAEPASGPPRPPLTCSRQYVLPKRDPAAVSGR